MKHIDIVDVKVAVKKGQITFYEEKGCIYAKNDIGEVVMVRGLIVDKGEV